MYHHRIHAQNVEKSGFQSLPVEHCRGVISDLLPTNNCQLEIMQLVYTVSNFKGK